MDNPAIFEPSHSLQIASSRYTKRESIICSSITRVVFLARRVLVHEHFLEMKYTFISVFQRWTFAISHATHPPHVRRRLRKIRIRASVTSRWRRYEQRYDPFPSTRRPRPCPLGAIGSCARWLIRIIHQRQLHPTFYSLELFQCRSRANITTTAPSFQTSASWTTEQNYRQYNTHAATKSSIAITTYCSPNLPSPHLSLWIWFRDEICFKRRSNNRKKKLLTSMQPPDPIQCWEMPSSFALIQQWMGSGGCLEFVFLLNDDQLPNL